MLIQEVIKKSVKKITGVIFPKLCIYCKNQTEENFFCSSCLSFFELLEDQKCLELNEKTVPLIECFEETGPISSFLAEAKKMSLPALPKVAASYMVCQYFNFALPLPDLIVPIPEGGGVQSNQILAKELSLLLKKPMKKIFTPINIGFFSSSHYVKRSSLKAKSVLIVGYDLEEKKLNRLLEKLQNADFEINCILLLVRS